MGRTNIIYWGQQRLNGKRNTKLIKKITPLKQPGNMTFRSFFTKQIAPRSGCERCFPASYYYFVGSLPLLPATNTHSRTNISWANFFSQGWQLGRTNIINWFHLSLNGKRNTKLTKKDTLHFNSHQNMNFRCYFTEKNRPEGRLRKMFPCLLFFSVGILPLLPVTRTCVLSHN